MLTSTLDLLRALRNKKNHYEDMPDNVKRYVSSFSSTPTVYKLRRPDMGNTDHGFVAETLVPYQKATSASGHEDFPAC